MENLTAALKAEFARIDAAKAARAETAADKIPTLGELLPTETSGTANRFPAPEETRRDLEERGIGRRYYKATFENIRRWGVPDHLAPAVDKADRYAAHFAENARKGTGILFIGDCGTMKTTLAIAVMQAVMGQGRSAYFIPLCQLFDDLIRMSKQRDNEEFLRFQERLKSTTLLVLDDLGTEYPSDWVRNKVDAIISDRYNAMKPIIITTNLTNGEILSNYQKRVHDRLRASSIVITMTGGSQRRTAREA